MKKESTVVIEAITIAIVVTRRRRLIIIWLFLIHSAKEGGRLSSHSNISSSKQADKVIVYKHIKGGKQKFSIEPTQTHGLNCEYCNAIFIGTVLGICYEIEECHY